MEEEIKINSWDSAAMAGFLASIKVGVSSTSMTVTAAAQLSEAKFYPYSPQMQGSIATSGIYCSPR
jgi:hypothetical protein